MGSDLPNGDDEPPVSRVQMKTRGARPEALRSTSEVQLACLCGPDDPGHLRLAFVQVEPFHGLETEERRRMRTRGPSSEEDASSFQAHLIKGLAREVMVCAMLGTETRLQSWTI